MSEAINQPAPARRLPLFILGVALFLVGPIAVAVQFFALGKLSTPWYQPILATLGVLLMIASVVQRGGVLRIVGVVVFALLCGAQWFMMGVMMRTPEYTGPAQPGKTAPAFTAMRADGKTFSNADLGAPTPTIVLFFRGHW